MTEKTVSNSYQLVAITPEITVKVSALLLGDEDNQTLISEAGESMERTGSMFFFMSNSGKVITALKKSLGENHTADEINAAVGNLRISTDPDTPYMECVLAMLGRKLEAPETVTEA